MKILTLLFCLLAFSIFVSAQTETLSCPKIKIDGPAYLVKPNETATFTVFVSNGDKYNIKYIWTVDSGEIVEGQNTPSMTVKVGENGFVRATVKIKGLPDGCENTVSEATQGDTIPQSRKFGEFSSESDFTLELILGKFIEDLRQDSNASGYIINCGAPAIIGEREKTINNYFSNKTFDRNRIVIIKVNSENDDSTTFWTVPAGAEPPVSQLCK